MPPAQGFLFAQAVPKERIDDILSSGHIEGHTVAVDVDGDIPVRASLAS